MCYVYLNPNRRNNMNANILHVFESEIKRVAKLRLNEKLFEAWKDQVRMEQVRVAHSHDKAQIILIRDMCDILVTQLEAME